jgi:hypothetical protein
MKNLFLKTLCFCLVASMWACGSSEKKKKYDEPSAVDKMVRDMDTEKTYAIVLHDMQMDEAKNLYQHKYKVTKNLQDSTSAKKSQIGDWVKVDEKFFAQNLNNMGLELASKDENGKIHKTPAPPGFNGYVGNEKYGNWKQDNNGNSFWEFYGKYMFMSSMINMMTTPVYRTTYYDYGAYRNNPATANRPYYGNSGQYGTNGTQTRSANPSFYERKQQQSQMSSFRQKVESNPARYTRSSTSSGNSNGTGSSRLSNTGTSGSSSSSQTTRSSSRSSSSSSSSTRSRGGSFGK